MPRFNNDGMKVLNVAEKNDAAKCLSQIMSRGQSNRREGYSKFNKIYEFQYNILGCNCQMLMTSVSGHLIDMDFSGAYKNWQNCQPVALFDAPISRFVPENFQQIKRTLQHEVRSCQALIIWTDGDREGENIGFEIIEVCKEVKPNIRLFRAKFSEITARAVTIACQNLIPPDENTSNAVEVRRELDLRIGILFVTFSRKKVSQDVDVKNQVKGLKQNKYKQVEEFIPEIFYKLKVLHSKDGCNVEFSWQRGRLFNERVCQMFCNMCQENPQAKVMKVISKPKSKWRPVPLDTVELEKLGSRKLRITAKETMKIAEKLYTQGIISYPRTETNIFPKGMDLTNLVQNQINDQQWGAFANGILQTGGPNPRQGKKTDNAHPPIHPTKYTNTLQGNEKRIYELIVRHFLACVSKDAKGQETIVEIEVASENFSAQGLMILERNYLDVYIYENWNAKNIAIYQQNDVFTPDNIEMVTGETRAPPLLSEADLIALMEKHGIGETRAPPLLSEADLIALMEKHGIGTDATHAEHIETIKTRQYVGVQNDGTFLPGQLGMGLVEGYDAMGFAMSKPYLRSALEADLKCICEGAKRRDDVLREQVTSYRNVFVQAAEQVEKLDTALSEYFGQPQDIPENADTLRNISEPIRKCPKCSQDDMILRKTKEDSWMLGCMGYPHCRNSIFFPKSVLKATKSTSVCSRCQPRPVFKIDFEFKKGSVPPMIGVRYTGCLGGCDEMLSGIINVKSSSSGGNRTNNQASIPSTNIPARNNSQPELSNRGSQLTLTGMQNQQNQPNFNNQRGANNNNTRGRQPVGNVRRRPTTATRGVNRRNFGGSGTSSGGNETTDDDDNDADNVVVCQCNQPTMKLTVRKEGANQGRQFYKCANNNSCNFFLWADAQEGERNNQQRGGYQQGGNQQQFNQNNNAGGGASQCKCGMPAAQRTVNKEGDNKGRQFYCCSKPRGQGCNHFEWCDGDNAGTNNSSTRGGKSNRGFSRGRGGGRGGGGNGGPPKKRKCGGCGQEGHTKRSCPFNR